MARVLIVEDEMLVAMLLEDMLVDLGHEPVGPVMRVDAALQAVAEETFDMAVLDINLAGKVSFPVAEKLASLGIPFMFASGYGKAGLIAAFSDFPVLQKPYDLNDLSRHLLQLES
ncbi:response regulator [Paracoccus sp. PAMC 22219]|uniref:response regulator n=1 Tax=Paracoccus sp. PAMC 22219 TaxID=1569209 RepID=UPI0005A6D32D|nr:response regulator [Paracoccus sp. PAMC 22219]